MRTNTLTSKVMNTSYPVLIICLCACFLFYKYILQVYPSIITDSLMKEFRLGGAGLGNLAATFYYTYMITQLLVGVLLDKYSTRLLTSVAIFGCAIGLILFSNTHSLFIAQLSRALMGVGVAFATISYMKLAAVWFSQRQYAFVSGLLATAAMAGAVFGQAPLSLLVMNLGWRNCLNKIGLIGFALAILFFLIVRDGTKECNKNSVTTSKDFLSLLRNKQNWLLTFYSGLAFSPIAIFGGLWGNPFLQQAYHLNSTQAAGMISLVFIGLGLGSPILGMLSDTLNNRCQVMLFSTLTSCFVLILVLYLPLNSFIASLLLFVFGFGLGAFMLVFTIGKEINPATLTATVVAMINSSDAILDGITEPMIGKILDFYWDGKMLNGIHYFSLHSYRIALIILPIYLLLAALTLLGVKERK